MRKIVLTFGLIAGAILAAMMFITHPFRDQIGLDRAAIVGYTTMVAAFLMVFIGVKSYRDNVAGGTVTFWKALQVGLLISLVATTCYVAAWELYYHKVSPDFADQYATYMIDKAKASGATEAELAAKAKEMADFKAMYQNPLANIALTFVEPLPVALLYAFLSAGVLSRKRRIAGAADA